MASTKPAPSKKAATKKVAASKPKPVIVDVSVETVEPVAEPLVPASANPPDNQHTSKLVPDVTIPDDVPPVPVTFADEKIAKGVAQKPLYL